MAAARANRAMDLDGTIKRHDGPAFEANPISRLTFWPGTRIVSEGGKRQLERSDLWTLNRDDMSINVWRDFKRNWKSELNEAEPSLFRAVRRTFGWMWLHSFLLQVMSGVLTFITPISLPYVLDYLKDKNMTMWYGYVYATLVVVGSSLSAFLFYHASLISWTLGLRIRSALSILIYRKTLCLAPEKNRNSGEIVNLISSDAQQILDTLTMFTQGSTGPIMIVITIGLLWNQIGAFALIPLGVLILSFPINIFLGGRVGFWKDEQQKATDDRVKLVKELISAIRIVKSYAWERPFLKNLTAARQKELDAIMGSHRTLAGLIFIITDVPPVGILLTFVLYGIYATSFDAARVFTSLTLLNQMRQPFIFLPICVSTGLQNKVALERIQAFALKPELPKKKKDFLDVETRMEGNSRVVVKNASFSWTNDVNSVQLKNLDMDVKNGELYMVIGRVGSGKSSLVQALLGEAPCVSGSVNVHGSVAYVSQEAWIVNGTVRDNILFGRPLDPNLYQRVVKAAALDVDLKQMPGGDLTEIGDRGVNLSGGQKQRVSIARALYCNRDVYILDDPFSAVDSHVAHHLFVHAVDGFIRATGKTAVVVTNQLQFLPMADHILMLQNGAVVERGSFEHLKVNGKQFMLLVAEFGVIDSQGPSDMRRNKSANALSETTEDLSPTALLLAEADEVVARGVDSDEEIDLNEALSYAEKAKKSKDGAGEKNKLLAQPPKSPIAKRSRRTGSKDSAGSSPSTKRARSDSKLSNDPTINTVGGDGDLGALVSAEQRETGNITTALYWYYMKGGSIAMLVFVLVTCLFGNIARIVATLFLSNWTTDHDLLVHTRGYYVGMFALFSGLEIMFVGLHLIAFILFAIRASKSLHSHLLNSILRATSAFFDATPMGRLMSRFAKDISLIDLVLPLQFDQYINMIFTLLSVITLVMVGTYWIIFIAVPVIIGYFLLTNYYRKTSIEIQRLESLSRAPVFSHLNETIEGASIIRSYNMVKAFKVANYNKVDQNTVDFYALRYCNMWLGLRLDWMGTLLLAGTWFGIIIARNLGTSNESSAGVALSAAVGLTFLLSNLSMNATETETRMNAVERIQQYTVVPQEAEEIIPGNRTSKLWPAEGKIQMNNVVVSYNKREQILKSMTCHIRPREKVGVVGRTGAGKSTLMAALLRLVEPSSGQIIIDGVDVLKIGLYDLRSKLSIIPQTPTMFIGTVRYNLDPFDEHNDTELWQALDMVQLKSYISSLPGKLMAPVEENGGNFSVGQRQLLAMARALVRNSNILLLDEATAAVDTETDAMIQRMIRNIFKDKTVITIAHRLNTIMDSDRVLVLDKGEIKEFDSPKNLLKDMKGIFTGMVEATGPSSAEHLRKIAFGELSVVENIIQQDQQKQKKRRDSQENIVAVLDQIEAAAAPVRRSSLSDSDAPPARGSNSSTYSPSTSPSDLPAMSPGVYSPIQMSTPVVSRQSNIPESPSSPSSSFLAPSEDDETIL